MEVEKLKQSVLVNLRSVIQSCKGGIPLNRLQNDYKLLIGATIPFNSLGFSSLENYLQNIPQVVKLKKTSDGQTIAEAVADSSTVHLQNLISKQKNNTKTLKCSVKRYGKKQTTPKQKTSTCPNRAPAKNVPNNSINAPSSASSSWSIASNEVSKDKEIEALKSKLAEQQVINARLSARINQLLSESEPKLEDEQSMIQRMKYQIGLLQRRILLLYSVSPDKVQVSKKIDEIVEKIEDLNITVAKISTNPIKDKISSLPNGNSLQVPNCDPFKLYQQQYKETEELKKQVQLQSAQIQGIERRMQSQHQLLLNQIKNISPSTQSKEPLKPDLKNELLEQQNLQIQNGEQKLMSEFSLLKNRVEKEYFVHLVRESEKLKEVEKQLKAQKKQYAKAASANDSKLQKLKNTVDSIDMKNLADKIAKQLVSSFNLSTISSISNIGELYIPPHRREQQSTDETPDLAAITVPVKTKKKKAKAPASTGATISSSQTTLPAEKKKKAKEAASTADWRNPN